MMPLVITFLVCLTAVTCVYIIAERWYAHRDRAYNALVASTATLVAKTVGEVTQQATEAAARLDAHVAAERSRLDKVENMTTQNDQAIQQMRLRGRP